MNYEHTADSVNMKKCRTWKVSSLLDRSSFNLEISSDKVLASSTNFFRCKKQRSVQLLREGERIEFNQIAVNTIKFKCRNLKGSKLL